MSEYPMVKGGEKLASSMSYGINTDGSLKDAYWEIAEERVQFASVLINLPVSQYKTEFAFRGYIVLEKGGELVTLYGPARANSIYVLAQRMLNSGSYPVNSEPYVFLQTLITDADAWAVTIDGGSE